MVLAARAELNDRVQVVDEGHFFSGKNTNTAIVANRLVTADHKWSVSGTPAKDLLGVEVDVSTMWNAGDDLDEMLEQRRRFNLKLDGSGAIESLGSLSRYAILQSAGHRLPMTCSRLTPANR